MNSISFEKQGDSYFVAADRLNGWSHAHHRYNFLIKFGTTDISVPIFVSEKIPTDKRDEFAWAYLKNMIVAISKKASEDL
jgi:hypothetical protein